MIVRFEDIPAVPWGNGAGTTRVLLVDGPGPTWTYRISVADLSGRRQQFSKLPGVDRRLVWLGPGALRVEVGSNVQLLQPHHTLSFAGESDVAAEPRDGPGRDLGIMTRRGHAIAELTVVDTTGLTALDRHPGSIVVAVALSEGCAVNGAQLDALNLLTLPADQPARIDGPAAVIQIDHLRKGT